MEFDFGIGDAADAIVNYILDSYSPALDAIADGIGLVTDNIEAALLWIPAPALISLVVLAALWRVGIAFALFPAVALGAISGMGLWKQTMETLSLVLAATLIALVIGIPLGIAMARKDIVATLVRPVLDLMQTMRAFV